MGFGVRLQKTFEFFIVSKRGLGPTVASFFITVDPLPEAPPTQPPPYRQIKLALGVHAGDLLMVRRGDGAKPQLAP